MLQAIYHLLLVTHVIIIFTHLSFLLTHESFYITHAFILITLQSFHITLPFLPVILAFLNDVLLSLMDVLLFLKDIPIFLTCGLGRLSKFLSGSVCKGKCVKKAPIIYLMGRQTFRSQLECLMALIILNFLYLFNKLDFNPSIKSFS